MSESFTDGDVAGPAVCYPYGIALTTLPCRCRQAQVHRCNNPTVSAQVQEQLLLGARVTDMVTFLTDLAAAAAGVSSRC